MLTQEHWNGFTSPSRYCWHLPPTTDSFEEKSCRTGQRACCNHSCNSGHCISSTVFLTHVPLYVTGPEGHQSQILWRFLDQANMHMDQISQRMPTWKVFHAKQDPQG